MRFFAEFTLSEILRSLCSLRMTRSEGLRMTRSEGLAMTQKNPAVENDLVGEFKRGFAPLLSVLLHVIGDT